MSIEAEIFKQQYITLREEIKETKARIFKTLGFGVFILPTIQYLVHLTELKEVYWCFPLLIVVVSLLYLSENNAKMRCGQYIREQIENQISLKMDGEKEVIFWENWLEGSAIEENSKLPLLQRLNKRLKQRWVDIFLDIGFFILFLVYYVISVSLAFTRSDISIEWSYILLGVFIVVGLWFGKFLVTHIRVNNRYKA